MWCLSCFKPSTSSSRPRREDSITRRRRLDDEQLARAIQESWNLQERAEEDEKRRARELENDAQLARAFQYQETERQLDNKPALEDEEDDDQFAKTVEKSLEEYKTKQSEEQVKKDEQFAQIVQESLNRGESPPRIEENKTTSVRVPLDVDEQLTKAVELSLKEKGIGKQLENDQVKKDEQLAAVVQESLNIVDSPPGLAENENISTRALLDEDEQLEKVIWESLKGKGHITQSADKVEEDGKLPEMDPPRSMCGGCNFEIEHGRSVDVLGVPWHPGCLWCDACRKQIAIHEVENHVSNSRGKFHKSCYERYCYVCKEKKMKMYNHHHFWKERYCPAHESDGTPKCCSCERFEPWGTNYALLGDGRWLCLECMESAVMDSDECQPLHFEIREFFEGLNMKIDKQFPFLLVEKQALNKAEKEEKIDYQYEAVTRGICLSEAQTVTTVSKGPRMGPNKQLIGMATESLTVVRECEVTAILILYGLPRVLTGYILAHEMMHAYLRLNGHSIISKVLEEGICQVLGHMWLDSQRYAPIDATAGEASSSASASRVPPAASESKKGKCSDFEKELVKFCKNQIETDDSPLYGVGFRKVNQKVTDSNLQETLKEIIRWG